MVTATHTANARPTDTRRNLRLFRTQPPTLGVRMALPRGCAQTMPYLPAQALKMYSHALSAASGAW
jgi:hypothetical protein